jgi:hypothetical protein
MNQECYPRFELSPSIRVHNESQDWHLSACAGGKCAERTWLFLSHYEFAEFSWAPFFALPDKDTDLGEFYGAREVGVIREEKKTRYIDGVLFHPYPTKNTR